MGTQETEMIYQSVHLVSLLSFSSHLVSSFLTRDVLLLRFQFVTGEELNLP